MTKNFLQCGMFLRKQQNKFIVIWNLRCKKVFNQSKSTLDQQSENLKGDNRSSKLSDKEGGFKDNLK